MPLQFLPIIKAFVPSALGGLSDYLRRSLLPPAPSTTATSVPYTPPFIGGQTSGVSYEVRGNHIKTLSDGTRTDFGNVATTPINGAITAIIGINRNGSSVWLVRNAAGQEVISRSIGNAGDSVATWENITIKRLDGVSETALPPPNPNPTPPLSSDGIPTSPPPNIIGGGLTVIQGTAIVPVPSFAAALAAALAAARTAVDALTAIRAIADAIDTLTDLLKKLKDNLDNPDEDRAPDGTKTVIRYNFGSISKDGFLRLYPDQNTQKLKCSYIDIQVLSIPVGYGRYFGSLSPNFYRFRSLGHISFVSPTFGIIETRQVDFSRISLECPETAYGFFYHLGLEGAILANASGFYVKIEK